MTTNEDLEYKDLSWYGVCIWDYSVLEFYS